MLMFILRRIGAMLATMIALTFIVFYLVNLPGNLEKIAKTEGNIRMTDEQVASWLEKEGYSRPFLVRYGEWVAGTVQGNMGYSRIFRKPVSEVVGERLGYTGVLMFWVMIVMVPTALAVGIMAGMREGSLLDRGLSVGSIASTSAPEYVTGIVFTIVFASYLGWLKSIAKAGDVTLENFTLPVMTMAMCGAGRVDCAWCSSLSCSGVDMNGKP